MEKHEIQSLIKEFFEKLTVPFAGVSADSPDNLKTTWFSIEVEDPRPFFDREGEAIFALNHLVRKMIEAKSEKKNGRQGENIEGDKKEERPDYGLIIDVNGFQKKRVENLKSMAHMMAERARYFKSNIEVNPMPAFERRIIHEFLSDATDLKTESEGIGRDRRVIIKYIGEL